MMDGGCHDSTAMVGTVGLDSYSFALFFMECFVLVERRVSLSIVCRFPTFFMDGIQTNGAHKIGTVDGLTSQNCSVS
jgi:hypothetical protein